MEHSLVVVLPFNGSTVYLQVRCLMDHGEFETQDGNILLLKKNSQVQAIDTC